MNVVVLSVYRLLYEGFGELGTIDDQFVVEFLDIRRIPRADNIMGVRRKSIVRDNEATRSRNGVQIENRGDKPPVKE